MMSRDKCPYPEIRPRVAKAMDDLFFQELLASKGLMQRRCIPVSLREKLEEFSLGRSSLNLAAGVVTDLSSWIVAPKTFMRIVTGYPFDPASGAENHNVCVWIARLKEKFPELEQYLTTFRELGYSLEVSRYDLARLEQ